MRNKILLAILIVLLFTSQNHATENFFRSDADLETWYSGYYLSPSPQRTLDALLYYGSSSIYYKETSRDQFAIFIGAVIKRNPDILRSIYQELTKRGNENSKISFLNALWFADTEESRDFIRKAQVDWSAPDIFETGEWLSNNPPFDALEEPITKAGHLDLLWSMFFATGEELPVKRIISALVFLDSKDAGLVVVGGAARWSLMSNAALHPKIVEICKQQIKDASGRTKETLKKIISEN